MHPTKTLAFALVFVAGCGSEKLDPKMQRSLDSARAYVDHYRHSHGSYPGHQEFMAWKTTNDLQGVCDYDVVASGTNKVYRVYIWLGERMRVYSSDSRAIVDPATLNPRATGTHL